MFTCHGRLKELMELRNAIKGLTIVEVGAGRGESLQTLIVKTSNIEHMV